MKFKIIVIYFIAMFSFNLSVLAASSSLQVSSGSVYVGDTFTVNVSVNSSAAWNVHTQASGPVSGCVVNQADATNDASDTNKTFSATCTATAEGTITVSLYGDVTSAQDGMAVKVSDSKSVTVTSRPEKANNSTQSRSSNYQNNNVDNRSTNNNLKEISVDGYVLTKVDDNNYTLQVSNDVDSINVNASLEDSKAKLSGDGKHELNVGENNIEIIITSESGSENKINIKVIRKDGYYLEDLSDILSKDRSDININIDSNSKLSSQDLSKIKESKKIVKLNYYDDNKKLIYSWIIDGNKINDFDELITTISFEPDSKNNIYKLSNYADGIYISVSKDSIIPKGTKIKLYVGDKYKDDLLLNIYYYNNKLSKSSESLKVKGGYIDFNINKSGDYFITMSNIKNSNNQMNTSILLIMVISLSILLLLLSLLMIIYLRKKKFVSIKN